VLETVFSTNKTGFDPLNENEGKNSHCFRHPSTKTNEQYVYRHILASDSQWHNLFLSLQQFSPLTSTPGIKSQTAYNE